MAIDYDLPPKSSKESQDICFIQKPNTTKKYLTDKFGEMDGNFVEISTGKKLGTHKGHYLYTIGQRKGIGIAAPYPLYVIDIDAEKNIVYLGKKEDDVRKSLVIENLNFSYPQAEKEFDAMVKIRYNMQAKKARIKILDDKDTKIYKIMPWFGLSKKGDELARLASLRYQKSVGDKFEIAWSKDAVEFVKKGVNKAVVLKEVLNHYHIKEDEVMVVGDSGNDVPLFINFPNSFVMKQAPEEVKEKAVKNMCDSLIIDSELFGKKELDSIFFELKQLHLKTIIFVK